MVDLLPLLLELEETDLDPELTDLDPELTDLDPELTDLDPEDTDLELELLAGAEYVDRPEDTADDPDLPMFEELLLTAGVRFVVLLILRLGVVVTEDLELAGLIFVLPVLLLL